MTWRVFGEKLETADLTSTNKYQKIVVPNDTVLLALKTWLIFYNSPSFTGLAMKLYANHGGVPGLLLYTSSNSWASTQLCQQANGLIEPYFEFNAPNGIELKADTYFLSLSGSSYTGSDSTHLAWRKAVLDPVNTTGVNTGFTGIHVAPYALSLISADLQ